MTLSIWRLSHLILAILSSIFLILLSITGVILAYDAIETTNKAHKIENLEQLDLAKTISVLNQQYSEVVELTIDYNDQVAIEAYDENGETIKGYIDPNNGKIIGHIEPKSDFIQWVTALHRSLFLKETGRIIVAIVSFFLFLISISGLILILKRQQNFKNFFRKLSSDSFSQFYHVLTGKIFIIPIIILSITATYIYLSSLNFLKGESQIINHTSQKKQTLVSTDFQLFKDLKLSEIKKIQFPFIPDDPEEFFYIETHKKELTINQINGEIVSETIHPYAVILESINLNLHTGRNNIIWAFVIGLASLNIIFFIYSGFKMTFERSKNKIKNKYRSDQSEIIILVGSENGNTNYFAKNIFKQLNQKSIKVYYAQLNQYQQYAQAKQIIILTSTYGQGVAPSNANQFIQLIDKVQQSQILEYSVIGFGSKSYPDFCAFAKDVDQKLNASKPFKRNIDIHQINDRSAEEFLEWIRKWNSKSEYSLSENIGDYEKKISKNHQFKIVNKQIFSDENTFKLTLESLNNIKISSGDLLAVYPQNNAIERQYSIGIINKKVELIVKLHHNGIGSNYLYNLNIGEIISTKVIQNKKFHLPKKVSQIAMISNGTGIAPFLGMIDENHSELPIQIFAGFRYKNQIVETYQKFATKSIQNKKLQSINFAFSKEEDSKYVMNLVQENTSYFINLLKNNGIIMICGSLAMQQNIEETLNQILVSNNELSLEHFKNQILTDCY